MISDKSSNWVFCQNSQQYSTRIEGNLVQQWTSLFRSLYLMAHLCGCYSHSIAKHNSSALRIGAYHFTVAHSYMIPCYQGRMYWRLGNQKRRVPSTTYNAPSWYWETGIQMPHNCRSPVLWPAGIKMLRMLHIAFARSRQRIYQIRDLSFLCYISYTWWPPALWHVINETSMQNIKIKNISKVTKKCKMLVKV